MSEAGFTSQYIEEDEPLECHNHCDWKGTMVDLDHPAEDEYRCPKCGADTWWILPTVSVEGER